LHTREQAGPKALHSVKPLPLTFANCPSTPAHSQTISADPQEIERRMDASRIDLSIVIVTWNARDYTLQCLKSLQQQDSELSTETIVVDNAFSDGTPDAVKREFSKVRLVENDSNLGFAKANNIGIRLCKGK
jgi:hypothetical protein